MTGINERMGEYLCVRVFVFVCARAGWDVSDDITYQLSSD